MSKTSRGLIAGVGVVVVLSAALLWEHFHKSETSSVGGAVASLGGAGIANSSQTASASASQAMSKDMPSATSAASAHIPTVATSAAVVAYHYMNGKVLSCSPLVLERMQGTKISFIEDEADGIPCTQYIGRTVRVEFRNEGDGKEALGLVEVGNLSPAASAATR